MVSIYRYIYIYLYIGVNPEPYVSIICNVMKTRNHSFGNGKHATYENCDDWGMVSYCLANILCFANIQFRVRDLEENCEHSQLHASFAR